LLVSSGILVSYGLFLNPFVAEFGWSRGAISGAYSLSSIIAGTVGVLGGLATDRLGPRVVVTVSGVLLGAGLVLTCLVDSLWQLYLFYGVLVGSGMSGLWVPPLSTVARWFSERRSLVTGIALSGMMIGQVILPPIVSRVIIAAGWRRSFLLLGIVAAVVIIAAAQLLRKEPPRQGTSGISEDGAAGAQPPAAGPTLGEALRTPAFWMVSAIFLLVGTSAFGLLIHLAPRVISVGQSEVNASNVLAVVGAVGIPGSFLLGGLLGHRIGDRRAFMVGLGLVVAALLLFLPAHRLWALYACAVIFGAGMSGMTASESPLVAWLFGLGHHGSIYAATGIGYTVGGALGPLLFGLIFDATGSYDLAISLAVGFAVIALLLLGVLRAKRETVPVP
jgi:MFS family permease